MKTPAILKRKKIMYNNKSIREFVSYVKTQYNARECDLYTAVIDEADYLIKYSKQRKSRKLIDNKIEEALSNCRSWLINKIDINEIKKDPFMILMYRNPRLYFGLLEKKCTK